MLTKLRIKLRQLYFKDTQFANLMTKRIIQRIVGGQSLRCVHAGR